MADLAWISQEARTIHAIFDSLFYVLVTVFLLLGIFIEYFKWPLGGVPSFGTLVGRAFVAAILLHTLPDVMNVLSDIADGLASKIGNLNQFKLVLARLSDKLGAVSFSWVSIKETIIVIFSFVSFFALYASVHVANAFLTFTWVILYVFSPLLVALFVLPSTAGATAALYRSLIEVSAWKIVWSVLAALLWSSALSDLNRVEEINFISVICLNLILAGSLLMTPFVVHALANGGIAQMTNNLTNLGFGPTAFKSAKFLSFGAKSSARVYNTAQSSSSRVTEKYFPKTHAIVSRMPRINVSKRQPFFQKPSKKEKT